MCSDRMLYESRVRIQPFDELQLWRCKISNANDVCRNQQKSIRIILRRDKAKVWQIVGSPTYLRRMRQIKRAQPVTVLVQRLWKVLPLLKFALHMGLTLFPSVSSGTVNVTRQAAGVSQTWFQGHEPLRRFALMLLSLWSNLRQCDENHARAASNVVACVAIKRNNGAKLHFVK